MSSVLILQHAEPETPGEIAAVLESEGIEWTIFRPYAGEPVPVDPGRADGLVLMGGPMGVHDTRRFPFLRDELALLKGAVEWGVPILGVCLGSQLLAAALGARVGPGPVREIGWHEVSLTRAAMEDDPLWKNQPRSFHAFHWHGEIFDLPAGAVSLAASDVTPHQAFRYGATAYGFLFHMEVNLDLVDAMCRAFPEELAEAGLSRYEVEKETERRLPALTDVGRTVFGRWARILRSAPKPREPGEGAVGS